MFEDLFQPYFESQWIDYFDFGKLLYMMTALCMVFVKEGVEEVCKAVQILEIKQALKDVTKYVVEDPGAFGCFWFLVYDGLGNADPFL